MSENAGITGRVPGASGTLVADGAVLGGTVHRTEYGNGVGAGASVILTGAIGDFGEAVTIYPNGKIDLEHGSEVILALTQDSFRMSGVGLDKEIVSDFSPMPVRARAM